MRPPLGPVTSVSSSIPSFAGLEVHSMRDAVSSELLHVRDLLHLQGWLEGDSVCFRGLRPGVLSELAPVWSSAKFVTEKGDRVGEVIGSTRPGVAGPRVPPKGSWDHLFVFLWGLGARKVARKVPGRSAAQKFQCVFFGTCPEENLPTPLGALKIKVSTPCSASGSHLALQ